jgi:hypothetical protein
MPLVVIAMYVARLRCPCVLHGVGQVTINLQVASKGTGVVDFQDVGMAMY